MTTTQVIITVLLAVFFVFASSIKLLGWQKTIFTTQLAFFVKYGLNRNWMFVVGSVELISALLIMAPIFMGTSFVASASLVGATALAAVSIGAIACHLWFDTWRDGVPAMVTFVLSAVLLLQGL
ncbi:DoxX family protein [Photobacterium rosenbergii]|uniref:DoxX family protein n=1 Tax=Photobacterium rosenbergii TaxID=294936 RepID=A0ABU3ZD96_9GAMM|nr:DoxX family protein [Photobacterium rosenbergii]MDV5168090.1 DoxX family protein [Photobacterium rosenbergii]